MKRYDIEKFCKGLEKGLDCSEYALRLHRACPEGDVLCFRLKDRPLFAANMEGTDKGWEYYCHYVFVCDGDVYDVLHNNIGIELDRYAKWLGSVNGGNISVDPERSSCVFGLPVL